MTIKEARERIIARLTDGRGMAHDYEYGVCTYRRESDGLPCAVGCLIADEHYSSKIEGACTGGLSPKDGKFESNTDIEYSNVILLAKALNDSGVPVEFLREMQEWQDRHDSYRNWNGNRYIGPLAITECDAEEHLNDY